MKLRVIRNKSEVWSSLSFWKLEGAIIQQMLFSGYELLRRSLYMGILLMVKAEWITPVLSLGERCLLFRWFIFGLDLLNTTRFIGISLEVMYLDLSVNHASSKEQFIFSSCWFICILSLISQLHQLHLLFSGTKRRSPYSHFNAIQASLLIFFCSGKSINDPKTKAVDNFSEWEGKEKDISQITKAS